MAFTPQMTSVVTNLGRVEGIRAMEAGFKCYFGFLAGKRTTVTPPWSSSVSM